MRADNPPRVNIPLKGGGESTGRSSLCAGATSLFFTGPIFVQKGQAEKHAATCGEGRLWTGGESGIVDRTVRSV